MSFDLHPLAYADLSGATTDEIAELCEAVETDTDEDTMQVCIAVDGPWHRQEPSRREATCCGLPIREPFAMGWPPGWSLRKHSYTGKLCPDCFTPFELGLAAETNTEETP